MKAINNKTKDGATMIPFNKQKEESDEARDVVVGAILLALVVISMVTLFYLPTVDREVECRDSAGNRIVGSNCVQANPEPIYLGINLVAIAVFLIAILRRVL